MTAEPRAAMMSAGEARPVQDIQQLQNRLGAAMAANTPGSGSDHVVIAMASYSVGESLLSHYAARIPAMEHRYLNAQLLLNRIDCDFVFVASERPSAEAVAYYLDLVRPEVAERMRRRSRLVVLDDPGGRPLAAKLLDRPDLIDEIRTIVGGRVAVIEPWNVTEHEVAVATALGVPINGTVPTLRSQGFKSAGRRLFARTGVPIPLGCEGVRTVEDVVAAMEHIRGVRPDVSEVVVKHDDSGAGDGNAVLDLLDASGAPLRTWALREQVSALPDWYLADLLEGGGVVEERVAGEELTSPSVQVDLVPGGQGRVISTHDQIIGGDNGQVYMGCRFPAHPDYAPEIARHGETAARELAARGCAGRASIDFMAARSGAGPWALTALEVNLRKGGTTHPFSALRNLVPGRYDAPTGRWVADLDGGPRAYRSTDNVVDAAWTGRSPSAVIDAVRSAGLQFDHRRGTGVVLHMLACLAVDGRFGATAIGRTPEEADSLFDAMLGAVSA